MFYSKSIATSLETQEYFVKKYFQNLYALIHKDNPSIFEFIRRYKSDAYYFDVQQLLRFGEVGYASRLNDGKRTESEISERIETAKEIVSNIDIFINKSILPFDIVVFRKVSSITLGKIKDAKDGIFTDAAFVSTCFNESDTNKIYKTQLIKILIPKGTKVIDMTSALLFISWAKDRNWENELTINRGMSYRVKESDSEEFELILEVIPE